MQTAMFLTMGPHFHAGNPQNSASSSSNAVPSVSAPLVSSPGSRRFSPLTTRAKNDEPPRRASSHPLVHSPTSRARLGVIELAVTNNNNNDHKVEDANFNAFPPQASPYVPRSGSAGREPQTPMSETSPDSPASIPIPDSAQPFLETLQQLSSFRIAPPPPAPSSFSPPYSAENCFVQCLERDGKNVHYLLSPTVCDFWRAFQRHQEGGRLPDDRIRSALLEIGVFPAKAQIQEMLYVAGKRSQQHERSYLTFGEFCFFMNDLKEKYERRPLPPTLCSKQPKGLAIVRQYHKFSSLVSNFQVFLGGACNPTSWRKDVAIPILSSNSISFYNPQRPDWDPQMIEIEDQAKQVADVLFFVVDNKTRSTSSMVEAAYLTGCDRSVFLVVKSYEGPGVELQGELMSQSEYEDLTKAQLYLTDIVERHGLPVFDDIGTAVNCAVKMLRTKDMRVQDLTRDDGAEPVKYGHIKLGDRFFGAGQVFQSYDPHRSGSIAAKDVCVAFKSITKEELNDAALVKLKPAPSKRRQGPVFNFDEFCCALINFKNRSPPPPASWHVPPSTGPAISASAPTSPADRTLGEQKGRWWRFRRFLLCKVSSWFVASSATASGPSPSSAHPASTPSSSTPSSPAARPSRRSDRSSPSSPSSVSLPPPSLSPPSALSIPTALDSGLVLSQPQQTMTHSVTLPGSFASSTSSGISSGQSPSFSSSLSSAHLPRSGSSLSSAASSQPPPPHQRSQPALSSTPPTTTPQPPPHPYSSSSRRYDVFLGGSIRDSSWRENIAIPELKKKGISYYHPKKSWCGEAEDGCDAVISGRYLPMEATYRENCALLLYVIDSTSRGLASMLEAAFYIGQGCRMVLCIREIPQGAVILQDKLSANAIRDYNRSRKYLSDIATREAVPVFDDISEAVVAAIEILEKHKASA